MRYLAHTAHWQFLGLMTGVLAWILIMAATGLDEWRLWFVDDASVVSSGVAWVGIWRACFYSHALPAIENCRAIGFSDPFTPPEIAAAQVLMLLALLCGLLGNVGAAVAVRKVYFSVAERGNVRAAFAAAGLTYAAAGALSLAPLGWNMSAVLSNATVHFPPDFHLPAAPARQRVGSAVGVGVLAGVLMLVSAALFLGYRYAPEAPVAPEDPRTLTDPAQNGDLQGRDNPAFHIEEVS
ncbi:Claudin-34 [Liparis tanakae]|uniref:Claudin-34 n=1 Tax=Liparis tanakae TaxID=230148 RepID=A0A4Z2EX07_9TELE|nr:Claudin-34 [Liparis tanakae]